MAAGVGAAAVPAIAFISFWITVVSTAALGWQVYLWRDRRRSHVSVDVRFALAMLPGSENSAEVVAIGVANRSDHTVRVSGAGLDLQAGSDYQLHSFGQFPGASIPGAVASHDSGSAFLPLDQVEAEGIDITEPVTAWARLATGELVKSDPTRLRQ